MSKISRNSDLNNIFTESSIDLPTIPTLVDLHSNNVSAYSETSDVTRSQQLGGASLSATSSVIRQSQFGGSALSATSSVIRQSQFGGAFSATSANTTNEKDVNTLLEMLTSENFNDSERTNDIENSLNNVLSGGSNIEVLPSMFSEISSELSDINNLSGGGVRYIITDELSIDQNGGAKGTSAGMSAFIKFKTFVSEKLNISNGIPAAKVAGAVLRDVKSKYENIKTEEAVKKAMVHLENNLSKYQNMAKSMSK
jgi:hypothetical protein